MKKLLFIISLFSSVTAMAQVSPSPFYIPTNPDSIIHVVNVNGVQRRVYNIDLVKSPINDASSSTTSTYSSSKIEAQSAGKADKTTLPLNAKDYGAKGDGTTDNAAALTTWLNAGSNLYLPSGTYKVSSQVLSNAARNNITITCAKDAIIVPTATFSQTTSVLRIENVTSLSITGINIQGNGAIASPALVSYNCDTYGVLVKNCSNVIIEKGYFTNQQKGAVYAESCNTIKLLNNTIPATYNYGFWVKSCTDVIEQGNTISGQGISQHDGTTLGQTPGILNTLCDRVLCEGNDLNDFKNDCTKSEGCNYVTYTNNVARNSGKTGIGVQGYNGVPVKKAVITNNTVEYLRPWATDGNSLIQIWDVEQFQITGNIIKGGIKGVGTGAQQEIGINAYASATGFTTEKGIIANNSIDSVGYHGIYLANVNNVTVNHNVVTDWAIDAIDSKGLLAEFGCTNVTIDHNYFIKTTLPSSGASNGIRFTGTNSRINDNTIQNVKDVGILSTLTAGNYFEVSRNTVIGSGQQGIYTSGTGTVLTAKYLGNSLINCGNNFTYSLDFGTTGLTLPDLSITNTSVTNTTAQNWLRTWGTGTITNLTLSNNTVSGSSLSTPTFTYTPVRIIGLTATAAPTTGTWKVGDVVNNSAPASTGYVGWVCTVAGTPGTWKGFGLIQ